MEYSDSVKTQEIIIVAQLGTPRLARNAASTKTKDLEWMKKSVKLGEMR